MLREEIRDKEVEAARACGGDKSCPVPTRPWVPFQHAYYLVSAAKKYQLAMAKYPGRISPGKLFTSQTVSHSMNIVGKEIFLCVRDARPPAIPEAPLTHLVTFFGHHLLDHITWLPGHLLWEPTELERPEGGTYWAHLPTELGRTRLDSNPIVW